MKWNGFYLRLGRPGNRRGPRRARAARSGSRPLVALTGGPPRSGTEGEGAAAVSSGERFLAAGGSSAQTEYSGDLPRPNRTEANHFPQSCCIVAPMPMAMADGCGAWRYAGESWPSHDRPKGAPPSWNPSGPLATSVQPGLNEFMKHT
jgi:hypothetical protein